MYKQLCSDGLGISVRQNELIELALTYRFRSIEIDMADMLGRAVSMGQEFATQFVNSASVEIGTFRLPIDFAADDEKFNAQLEKIELICELSQKIEARRCFANISPVHPSLPYHENFDLHRQRITTVADKVADAGLLIGLKLNATPKKTDDMQFIHKADEIATLVKTIDHDQVGLVLDTWHWQAGQGTMNDVHNLNINKITEVRLADPPETLDASTGELRMIPGSHPASICKDVITWLQEQQYDGPVALTAQLDKGPGNSNENLFRSINTVFEKLLAGEALEATEEPTAEEPADEEAVSAAAD